MSLADLELDEYHKKVEKRWMRKNNLSIKNIGNMSTVRDSPIRESSPGGEYD